VPGLAATHEVSGSALLRRSFRKSFPPAVHGEGAYLWDAQGKQYLDFSGSAAVNFIGHGVWQIVSAMTAQARSLEFVDSSQFTTPVAEQYARELLNFAGENFRGGAVYFCSGGTEALESAVKLAKQYQMEVGHRQRSQVVDLCAQGSVESSWHCGGRRAEPTQLDESQAIEAQMTEANDKLAAFIIEPGSGDTLKSAGPGYLKKVIELCRQRDVLLIDNEATSGMGRTGRNFAVDHWGVAPDILVAAKGLSSGYAPVGAVILSRLVANAISSGSGSFIHGFTYSSHPISLAAGRAVLQYILEHNLIQVSDSNREGTIAHHLREALKPLRNLSSVDSVCGMGLLWRIGFASEKRTATSPLGSNFANKVAQAAAEMGLLVCPVEDSSTGQWSDQLLIAPPAVITAYQVSWACDQLAAAIEQASAHA
jgi:adenosylmethionine-8-amino-7-oxononanoate aminotransferase